MGGGEMGPFAATFSICTVNPDTGEAGVAVASACLSVGSLVPYAEAGVGAVATQAFANPAYGPDGLALLRKGVAAADAVRRLTAEDITITPDAPEHVKFYRLERMVEEGRDFLRDPAHGRIFWFTSRIRQLGLVDRRGNAATYDGALLPAEAASITGEGFCCQGNTLASRATIAAMASAYEEARGRSVSMLMGLMAALRAGETEGGDRRGKRSAAVLVVRDRGHWSGTDCYCDARVDDDDDPVARLSALADKYEQG